MKNKNAIGFYNNPSGTTPSSDPLSSYDTPPPASSYESPPPDTSSMPSTEGRYVAPWGNDNNNGLFATPWKSWTKGFNMGSVDYIVYFRGGTYTSTDGWDSSVCIMNISNKDGTSAASPIRMWNYPGEIPILDGNSLSTTSNTTVRDGILMDGCAYWDFRGLHLTRVFDSYTYYARPWQLISCHDMRFYGCSVSYSADGFSVQSSSYYIYYKNCDAHDNCDKRNGAGYANGWSLNCGSTYEPMVDMQYCRAWNNSDDGWDFFGASGKIKTSQCWAWHNGWGIYGANGNGMGFKLGQADTGPNSNNIRTTFNNISWDNMRGGFDESNSGTYYYSGWWYNNTSIGNDEMEWNIRDDGIPHYVKNNASIPGVRIAYDWGNMVTQANNSWQGAVTINSSDFVTTSPTGCDAARTNLDPRISTANSYRRPDTNFHFMRLVAGSDLIDKGEMPTASFIRYSGSAPDMGAREYGLNDYEGTTPPPPASSIPDSTPSIPVLNEYYVAINGSNSNPGTFSQPWRTLAYATYTVTAGARRINMGAGTFAETSVSNLKVGNSILGQGATTIITSSMSSAVIVLSSSAEGTDGYQSISYIKMNGNMTGDRAIDIMARKNVNIHHCEFINFFSQAVAFYGRVAGASGAPTIWASGCQFHHNIVTNCAKYVVGDQGWGNLRVGGTIGMLIYDNVITQTARTSALHGYCIKFCGGGWNKGLKIYNNDLIMPEVSSNWDFALEMFHCLGGFEIYNNNVRGTLDFGSSISGSYITLRKGDYDFALKVYDNYCYNTQALGWSTYGVDLEDNFSGGIYIYRNKFENLRYAFANSVKTTTLNVQSDVYIYYNVVIDPRITSGDPAAAFKLGHDTAATYNNWNVWNNTGYSTDNLGTYGLRIYLVGSATNISIKNNIMRGFTHSGIYIYNSTINGLQLQNNLLYGNGGGNVPVYSNNSLSNTTINGNLSSNPLFVSTSDFHLQANSPCINGGLNVGLTTDYDQHGISGLPDIGAYEYEGVPPEESSEEPSYPPGIYYFVSPNGNDSNNGSYNYPWKSWQKGFESVPVGRTLYIRGGTYTSTDGWYSSTRCVYTTRSGTSTSKITVRAFPGETPVLDGSALAAGLRYGIVMSGCSYWDIYGLVVEKVLDSTFLFGTSWEFQSCHHMMIHTCTTRVSATGFSLQGICYSFAFNCCDGHDNSDRVEDGKWASGFSGNVDIGSNIEFYQCRAWNNSYNGFNMYGSDGYMKWTECWAWHNGWGLFGNGLGSGFKLGQAQGDESAGVQRLLYRCMTWGNAYQGFESCNFANPMVMFIYNCTSAYNEGVGYDFIDEGYHRLWNDMSFSEVTPLVFGPFTDWSGCSWSPIFSDIGMVPVSSHFVTVSDTGTDAPTYPAARRPESPFLPVTDFMMPVIAYPHSWVDAAMAIPGFNDFVGNNPDIGARENPNDNPYQ